MSSQLQQEQRREEEDEERKSCKLKALDWSVRTFVASSKQGGAGAGEPETRIMLELCLEDKDGHVKKRVLDLSKGQFESLLRGAEDVERVCSKLATGEGEGVGLDGPTAAGEAT